MNLYSKLILIYLFTIECTVSAASCLNSTESLSQNPPLKLSQTGIFENTAELKACASLIPYSVNVPLWSDGAEKKRWIFLPKNGKIEFSEKLPWKFPIGTLLIKHFELKTSPTSNTRVETRFLIKQGNETWFGYTYQWDDQQKDATLLTDGGEKTYLFTEKDTTSATPRKQLWSFPSRQMCLQCHNPVGGPVLGIRTEQFSQDQLESWNKLNLFSSHLEVKKNLPNFVNFRQTHEPLEKRVRSYLDVNCAHCHQPNSPVRSQVDLRFQTPLALTNTINALPNLGDMDLDDPVIIKPGEKSSSVLWLRLQCKGTRHMPPFGSNELDSEAVEAIGTWITHLPGTE